MTPRITPYLWFETQAEEAAAFYCSLFPNSRITHRADYPETSPFPERVGQCLMVQFELDGQAFAAFNGGAPMPFTHAISLMVDCESQAELDALYARLTEGGQAEACGWLRDRYGLSWQLVPRRVMQLLQTPSTHAQAFGALMTMEKIDLAAVEAACNPS
ncbi:putative 3-demethylubiquinone-9 3-methyltransferase (glyoxalase superfamily) [Inhella inkyongensis]|uniref:Putative 3-demethylubiquinone-9 3-methyltransferase (Glyoxalase superfamily) n=1 Tax=Inhella inkyongensis TaxID=392593 RepID=A0A840S0N9_9BURK|nr:VOC family protein [Inhella inkyongensis]MBB5202958.1 putative 3-demethylubiquinone-9 3-methyltransferase (glyoxalase superfamily) [Inhella inkyongensis]